MNQDNKLENKYVTNLSALSIFDHFKRLFKTHLLEFIATLSTVFLAIWGILDAFDFFGFEFSFYFPYGLIITVSLLIAFCTVAFHYYKTVPSGFESESRTNQKLAHFKRPKWEFKLTRNLLISKLSLTDTHIDELLEGQHFVPFKAAPNQAEYMSWLELRIDNIEKMVSVATYLMVFRLPGALRISKGELASELEILKSIETIQKLYRQTYKFEAELQEIKPPPGFERIHKLQENWSEVVRDSVNQFHDLLNQVIHANFKKGNVEIEFMITVDSPDKMDEFIDEVDKIITP